MALFTLLFLNFTQIQRAHILQEEKTFLGAEGQITKLNT